MVFGRFEPAPIIPTASGCIGGLFIAAARAALLPLEAASTDEKILGAKARIAGAGNSRPNAGPSTLPPSCLCRPKPLLTGCWEKFVGWRNLRERGGHEHVEWQPRDSPPMVPRPVCITLHPALSADSTIG